jgi:tellurite resistance protein TehA-like permease
MDRAMDVQDTPTVSPYRARLRREVRDLNPGYCALVMATAIVSTGLGQFGQRALSDILLVVGCVAFVVLLAAYAWRLVAYRRRALDDARDASQAFGYFSLVAAADVLAVRFASDHDATVTLVLGAASAPLWLLLTYGIPGAIVLGRQHGPVLPGVNGNWFLWVVATQSLSTTAATLAGSNSDLTSALAPLAVALWGTGVVLYLLLVGVVTIRLLELPVRPHALSPAYWIYMGATAITVLAAARILALPSSLPVIHATHAVVSGLGFVLWAFGTWWIPLLLVFAVWQHAFHPEPLRYEAPWWSMVFPLGMYVVSSASYGRATGLGFMADAARVEVWLGLAAWVAVFAAMVGSFVPLPSLRSVRWSNRAEIEKHRRPTQG